MLKRKLIKLFCFFGGIYILRWVSERVSFQLNNNKKWILKIKETKQYQVLVYHDVGPSCNGIYDPVSPGVFEAQMEVLSKYCNVCSIENLLDAATRDSLPPFAVGITFDDGYLGNYTYAFPILKKYKLPATIFLTTGAINKELVLWHDCLTYIVINGSVTTFNYLKTDFDISDKEGKSFFLKKVLSTFKKLSLSGIFDEIHHLIELLEVDINNFGKTVNYLDWVQVQEMAQSGLISFAPHTKKHPILTNLSKEEQEKEISQSIGDIGENLGAFAQVFAYPNGRDTDFDSETIEILKKHKIKAAFTTNVGCNDKSTDLFRLKRGGAWEDDPQLFIFRLFLNRLLQ